MDEMRKYRDLYRIPSNRYECHTYDDGVYFVTICTVDRAHFFGEVVDGNMCLNTLGRCVDDHIGRLPELVHYADIPLWVVMPNHVHLLVYIDPLEHEETRERQEEHFVHISPRKGSLGAVVRSLKSGVTKWANEQKMDFAWQTRYHDRIVRTHDELNTIATYIENNPARWAEDEMYEW